MAVSRLLFLLVVAVGVSALKFDLPPSYAYQQSKRCVSQYSNKDALIIGNYKVSSNSMTHVSLLVSDRVGNRLHSNPDITDPGSFVITSPAHSDIDFCFSNILNEGVAMSDLMDRTVDVTIKTGYDAMDYNELAKRENLNAAELELRKMEGIVQSIVNEREFLSQREEALRNTNESTYERVKWFSIASMALLVISGIYQVIHMRSFLKKKKAI